MKILEYFINTPGLHRDHHGLGENGVPCGNFAQTLFIWDVMFGTRRIQHRQDSRVLRHDKSCVDAATLVLATLVATF